MKSGSLKNLTIGIKGAGEIASGIAWRLHRANFHQLFMLECPSPLAVRREVSFCEAVFHNSMTVEGLTALKAESAEEIRTAWERQLIPVLVDPSWTVIGQVKPDVVIDAIIAKQNLGTGLHEAPLVIALGPGFEAGVDAHAVIETNRGHNLGRVLYSGKTEPDTSVPGDIGGYTVERVLRAPADGFFHPGKVLGENIKAGEIIGDVDGLPVRSQIDGVLRGLIAPGGKVQKGLKIGDIDPRNQAGYCQTISEKARAIGGSVLEAILTAYNG